jgi:hypothetical protein
MLGEVCLEGDDSLCGPPLEPARLEIVPNPVIAQLLAHRRIIGRPSGVRMSRSA